MRHSSPSSNVPIKPFLIVNDGAGNVTLTLCEIRHNSQGYPWVTQRLVETRFKSSAAARAYAVEQFGAKAGEFSFK